MAVQKLVWTALPNGVTPDGLRVSVALSPRLDPEGDPRILGTFSEWLDWPATLARATFTIDYDGTPAKVAMTELAAADRVDDAVGVPDSAAWTALFAPDLPVIGAAFTDHSDKQVVSYETTALAAYVEGLYGSLAAAVDGELPTITQLLNTPRWDSLLGHVGRVDGSQGLEGRTGVRNAAGDFDRYREDRFKHLEGPAGVLARAQLFHTPPSAQKPVVAHPRRDDPRIASVYREHVKTDLPRKEDIVPALDFHKIVGAMASYPTVLRRLGLVVDFVLDPAPFADNPDGALSVSVEFDPGALQTARATDVSPVTRAALGGRSFAAVSNPAAGLEAKVPGRLLHLDPDRFDILQMDVDGAGLKLLGFARSLRRMVAPAALVDSVTRRQKRVGASALRTAGLMLVQRDRGRALEQKLDANAVKNAAAQQVVDVPGAAPPKLYAEDVLRGFRFDIWDATTGLWRSLCRREASYVLGSAGLTIEPAAGEEEGIVRMATTTSPDKTTNQDLLWLHEAVVSWTGWSLTAPPPGRAILPDDSVGAEAQTEAELPPGMQFSSRYRAVRGSLPRLRYGRRYWIRARAVDLAGNSLDPREDDFGPEQPRERARPFLRYEPVAAPVVALVRRTDDVTEVPAAGESMLRMAIRTFNDTPADNAVPATEVARRFAVPQQVSAREAEQHAMLDDAGKVDPATFDMLANQKDRDALDPDAALVEEKIPLSGPLDDAPVETTFAVYRDGKPMTYLPDPLARTVAARIFSLPGTDPKQIIPIDLYDGGSWPEAIPFKVEVVDKPGAVPEYDAGSRTLIVPLPKAERALLRLSLQLSKRALRELMGVWRWVASPTPELEELALTGQHWMLTPWTEIELVHAVQRPLLDPELVKLSIDRGAGDTSARPRFIGRVSIKSTDRIDLLAEWNEPSDDPSRPESEAAGVNLARGDTAFAVKITDIDSYAALHDRQPGGGIADHAILAEDTIDVGAERVRQVARKVHEFGDTRYRRIEYWMEGTTRFREFLPKELLVDPADVDADGQPQPTEEHIKVVGPREVRWIPSSAPPPAPSVLYVVPTFGWTRSEGASGTQRSWRRGGGLRVYLDRPWNVTGYGEMLAVVLAPPAFTGDPETQPAGRPYKQLVTQWGNDPIWASTAIPAIAPARTAFPRARTAPDPAGGWLPAGAPATEADQPPGPFGVTALGDARAPLEIAPHDVAYDAERRLWYCDIEIEQGATYFPFVRLALARYQPVSVAGCELSEIVLADFMPLAADRSVSVTRGPGALQRRVVVSGHAPADSSGHAEARSAPATPNRRAADVAPSTVFDAWVERLDPALGEDFGWQRVPEPAAGGGGIAAGGIGVQAQPGAGRFGVALRAASAAKVTQARELKAAGRFREILDLGVDLGRIFKFFQLFDRSVTLPEPPSPQARFRLVVAEYEEYLVDDAEPYDAIPTQKGRRLVFVEHVELT